MGSDYVCLDSVGNRTYETTDTGNTTYTYNTNMNKLASATGEKNLERKERKRTEKKERKERGQIFIVHSYVAIEDLTPAFVLKVGKPVGVASGNVYTSETDFSLKGIVPFNFTRYYHSTQIENRDFGQQWGHSFDTRVVNEGLYTYSVINPDGSMVYYMYKSVSGNTYIYDADLPKGERGRLIKNTDNTFVREFTSGSKEEFNNNGYLTAIVDINGNRTTITRDANGIPSKITDASGKEIILTNESGKIKTITLPGERTYNYAYDPTSGYLAKVTYPDGSERNYEYVYTDSDYKLSGVKDENGNYIEKHDYDTEGRAITSSADGTNEKLTINYTDDTHSTVTDTLGRITTYTINKSGGKSHATNISGPGCKSCGQGDSSYTYDDNLNVKSTTDANGNITKMTYDTSGNMLTKTEAYGTIDERTTDFTYNSFGQILTETIDGITTKYTYDDNGNILTKTEAFGTSDEITTGYTYYGAENYHQLQTVTDPNSNLTEYIYSYDASGHTKTERKYLDINTSLTTIYRYDIMGNLLSTTDANGNATSYQYDLKDRLVRQTNPDGGIVNYEYDLAGNRTAITDANGNRTTFTYDNLNHLIKTTDPNGNSTDYTYDTEGNMETMTIRDNTGNIKTSETYTYDDHNRLKKTIHIDNTYTEQTYDAVGNIHTKRDENGNITTFEYDALNRLKLVISGNIITSYTYDKRNNLKTVTDANSNVTTYNYDSLNRLISTISPDTGTTTYSYDPVGNMTSKTDASGITTTYIYDALNRQTAIQFPDPSGNITYTYDDSQRMNSKGRLTSMTDLPAGQASPSGTTWYD